MTVKYFLNSTILGVDGNAHNWIELTGFSFGAESATDLPSKTFGPPQFSALQVNTANDAFADDYLKSMFNGDSKQFFITAVDIGVGSNTVLYELAVNGTLVDSPAGTLTSFHDSATGGLSFDILFDGISLTTTSHDRFDTLFKNGPFTWDDKNDDSTPVTPVATFPSYTSSKASGAKSYFLQVDGFNGASADANHKGWFDVTDFSFDASRSGAAVDPASLAVTVESDAALTALLLAAAQGTLLAGARIEGMAGGDGSGIKVYDLAISNALVTSVDDVSGPGYTVAFEFDTVRLETFDDKIGSTGVAGWSFITKRISDFNPTLTTGAGLGTISPSSYFLALSDFRGESVDSKHKGWFEIEGFDFGLKNPAGTGSTDIGPITVTLESDHLLGKFIQLSAADDPITQGTIAGSDGTEDVYTLNLGFVKITDVHDLAFGGLELTLDFESAELSTKTKDKLDNYVDNPSFGWNDKTDTTTTVASAAPYSGTLPVAVVPTKYYMLVDGMNGGSTDASHLRWFEIDGFGFNSRVLHGGIREFDPVHVDTTFDMSFNAMLQRLTTGTPINAVRIQGVVDVGGIEKKVYDLELTNVAVQSVSDHFSIGYGVDFDYNAVTVRTYDPTTGLLINVGGWDRAASVAYNKLPGAKTTAGAQEGEAFRYFLSMEGVAGDALLKSHKNWLEIDDLSFGAARDTLKGAYTLDPAQASNIALTFGSDAGLA